MEMWPPISNGVNGNSCGKQKGNCTFAPRILRMEKLIEVAIQAALEGGKEILEVYSKDFDVEFKSDESPLTQADRQAHLAIERVLQSTKLPLLSEEGKSIPYEERKDWKQFWMVDPLDGTKEFVKRNGEFTVNIALIEEGKPVLGVIFVPVSRELYFAATDLGSFKMDEVTEMRPMNELLDQARKLPIHKHRDEVVIVASRSHLSPETEAFFAEQEGMGKKISTLSRGSSLKLCMVAEGKADFYPRYAPTMEWDTAAGQAICELAGFSVNQYQTQLAVRYNKENLLNPWFLVS